MAYKNALVYTIDDDPDVLEMISDTLAPGFDVISFGDPQGVLAASRAQPADVYVLDYILPKMNGIQLAQTLKDRGIFRPFLMLSGRTGYKQAQEAMDLGVIQMIDKPFEPDDLMASVSRAAVISIQNQLTRDIVNDYKRLVDIYEGLLTRFQYALKDHSILDLALTLKGLEKLEDLREKIKDKHRQQEMLAVAICHFVDDEEKQ